jgi:hypothetical protein
MRFRQQKGSAKGLIVTGKLAAFFVMLFLVSQLPDTGPSNIEALYRQMVVHDIALKFPVIPVLSS